MPSKKLDPLFPTWRTIWDKRESLRKILQRIEPLRELRSQGNFVLPSLPREIDRAALKECFDTVSGLIALQSQLTKSAGSEVEKVALALVPILPAIRWGRWLYLEKALEQATATGDLLFSAVILRSLGEEVLRLRALQIGYDVAGSISPDEIRAWAAAVIIAIEPLAGDHSGAKTEKADHFAITLPHAEDTDILKCMKALNDYIHPNYGSHIVALYPESAEGCMIILHAVEKILDAFLKLSWANDPPYPVGVDIGEPYIADFDKIIWRFKSRTTKTVTSHARSRYSLFDFYPEALIDWFSSDDTLYREALKLPQADEILKSLRDALAEVPIEHYWRVNNAKLTFKLATARRAEEMLCNRFPHGAPSDQTRGEWFLFAAHCFELMVMTTALKLEYYRMQMVCQIVDQNVIGITACMRSLLEHVAISQGLLDRLENQWNLLQKRTQSSGSLTAEVIEKIETELIRFLAGTMGTAENVAPWAELRAGINVTSAVSSVFEDYGSLQSEYDFSSAALHGRLMRSLELCAPNKDYIINIVFRGVRCLEWVCSRDLAGDHLRQTLRIWLHLKNMARALNEDGQTGRHALAQALGGVTKLKPVRDFSGTGSSANDPIIFRPSLHYHSAFYQYCAQEDVDPGTRMSEVRGNVLYDVLRQDDQQIWFKAGALPDSPDDIGLN